MLSNVTGIQGLMARTIVAASDSPSGWISICSDLCVLTCWAQGRIGTTALSILNGVG
jgi:hypothetical protein